MSLKGPSLSKYGYSLKIDNAERQAALRKALANHNQKNIKNKLRTLSILHSKRFPKYANAAKKNLEWIATFEIPNNFFNNVPKNRIYVGPRGGKYKLVGGKKVYLKG
jgi:hypothetical protein